jgi:peptidoglycan/xylan/chitin deacetylase (PgdA/CDA1 family)
LRSARRYVLGACVAVAALVLVSAGSTRPRADTLGSLIKLGVPVYCGGGHGHWVALTFDDGPGWVTPSIVKALDAGGVKGTFFLIGRNVVRKPGWTRLLARREAAGDHTWSHPVLSNLTPRQARAELERTKKAIEARSGVRVRLFRPSFGGHNPMIDSLTRRLGMLQVLWNVDSGDASEASTPSPQKIYENVAGQIKPGAIVLMHENITGAPDVEALKLLLPELRRRGLTAVTVPELLTLDPPDASSIGKGPGACD